MTINVTKYRLNPDRIFAGTRGSYGMEKLSFDFGDGWDFDTISVTFHPQRGKPIKLPILPGTEIDIPAEVMEHSGESRFVVSGRAVGEDGTIERQAITLEGYVDVAYTSSDKGGNTRKVTPDVYDLFLSDAKDYMEEVLRAAKDSGVFDGEDGVSIKKIEQTAASEEDGGINVITVTLEDERTFEFRVRNGAKGSNGITPHIGVNGNWYIGDTDTGVLAGGGSGGGMSIDEIYILGEEETVDDAPDTAKEIIDPYDDSKSVDLGQFATKEDLHELSGDIANLGGGMNATAKSLLITILRNGVYTSDQSATITALEAALNESGGDDDTDTGGVTQMGSVLYITGRVTATQSGTVLQIA